MADANALLKPEVARGNAAIDTISKPMVALAHGLDDRGGVDARTCLERIVSKHGVVAGEGNARVGVSLLHVFTEQGQVIVDGAHQLQVHQSLVQWCVARALTKTEGRAMNNVCTGLDGSEVVRNTETTVLVPVPVDLDL